MFTQKLFQCLGMTNVKCLLEIISMFGYDKCEMFTRKN